jgi:hypothetical protein
LLISVKPLESQRLSDCLNDDFRAVMIPHLAPLAQAKKSWFSNNPPLFQRLLPCRAGAVVSFSVESATAVYRAIVAARRWIHQVKSFRFLDDLVGKVVIMRSIITVPKGWNPEDWIELTGTGQPVCLRAGFCRMIMIPTSLSSATPLVGDGDYLILAKDPCSLKRCFRK